MALIYNTTAGDIVIDRASINAVRTPAPLGPRHRPVGFGDYIDLVERSFARHGLEFRNQEFVLSNGNGGKGQSTDDTASFFGLVEVGAIEGELITAKEWSLLVGLRGSHDQKIARGLCIGSRVLVCSNLCFNGNVANFATKQTTNVWDRLPGLVDAAVAKIPALAHDQVRRTDALKTYDLKPRWGDAALVELNRRGALTPAQLGRAIAEWDEPSYAEHAEDGFTAWRLVQAVTEAQKPTGQTLNPHTIVERTTIASKFIDDVIGFHPAFEC